MNSSKIIDGKVVASELRQKIKSLGSDFIESVKSTPGLAVVLVGENPASQVYVRNKISQTKEVGFISYEYKYPENVSEEELLNLILDIVTGIIDDVANTAFCMVQDIISGITTKISDLVGQGLGSLSSVTSLISEYGDWGGSWVKKIGDLVALFCDGQLSCILGIGEYTTKEGESSDNSITSFMLSLIHISEPTRPY